MTITVGMSMTSITYIMGEVWVGGLTGGLHLKSYSQQFNIQLETSNKCCPSGVHIGTSTI